GVRGNPEVNALASRQERAVSVLVWNYHDDDLPASPTEVEVIIEGLPNGPLGLTEYRVDAEHSNSYEAWKKMGSPQKPSPEQYKQLEQAGHLQRKGLHERLPSTGGRVTLKLNLPRQGVSLLRLTW